MSIEDKLRERIPELSEDVRGGPSLQRALQKGRARRRRRAVAAVGSGVATVCAVGVVAGAALTGAGPFAGEAPQQADEPQWTLAVPPEKVPYAIERAVRQELPGNAKISYTKLQAYGKGSKALPKSEWDEATAWYGTFMVGSGEQLSVELLHAASETEGDPHSVCRGWPYLRCDFAEPDGVQIFNTEEVLRNEAQPGAKTPGPWGAIPAKDIRPDRRWYEREVEVQPGGDYLVRASDTINVPTYQQAQAEWILGTDSIRDIATNGEFLEDPSDS